MCLKRLHWSTETDDICQTLNAMQTPLPLAHYEIPHDSDLFEKNRKSGPCSYVKQVYATEASVSQWLCICMHDSTRMRSALVAADFRKSLVMDESTGGNCRVVWDTRIFTHRSVVIPYRKHKCEINGYSDSYYSYFDFIAFCIFKVHSTEKVCQECENDQQIVKGWQFGLFHGLCW